MHFFADSVLVRGRIATLLLGLAGLLAGCGGGGSASGDPNRLSFDELVIPAGEERAYVAERVTIRTRFDVKGTLALSLPAGSTADKVVVDLPPGTVIEGTIALRQPVRAVVASTPVADRKQATAAGARAAAFVPRQVPSLLINGIPGLPIFVMSGARFETPAGDDAPDEVFASLAQLDPTTLYFFGSAGGNGGDVWFRSGGPVVFSVAGGSSDLANFQPFAPGNGGKGADVVFNDGTWNDAGIERMSVHAGPGGRSGRIFVDVADLRLDGVSSTTIFVVRAAEGSGIGGAGGRLLWDVVQPDLTSMQEIALYGGSGGSGVTEGGPGGLARYIAGKPIVSAASPRPVRVAALGGRGGIGGEDDQGQPMIHVPNHRTPIEVWFGTLGGAGGSVTAIAHTGRPGTAAHPDGYEPGPLEVQFGSGGEVSAAPSFAGKGGKGAGIDAGVSGLVQGGAGGDGWSACVDPQGAGGAGGRSGHVSVRAGAGGSGQSGGDAGALHLEGIEVGRPGRGGKGVPGGTAGLYGQPQYAVMQADAWVLYVREETGLRLIGVRGGPGVGGDGNGDPTLTNGDVVLPAGTAGDACSGGGIPPAAGLVPLTPPTYRARSWSSAAADEVDLLEVTVLAGCMFFDPKTAAVLGPGYGTVPCMNVHEVKRDTSSPTGWTIIDRTVNTFGNGDLLGQRVQQFIQRVAFCGVEGNLVLPGSGGFTERFEPIDINGNVTPGLSTFIVEHTATGAPIFPAEVERAKDLCCAPSAHYPNGRGSNYVIRSLVEGVCAPPLTNR